MAMALCRGWEKQLTDVNSAHSLLFLLVLDALGWTVKAIPDTMYLGAQ